MHQTAAGFSEAETRGVGDGSPRGAARTGSRAGWWTFVRRP